MKISTVVGLLIASHFIQGLLGLPVDRELYRVKRKGDTGIDLYAKLVRKVRRTQDDKETEIKHKRRFFAPETTEHKTDEGYKTKMEERSSRSSREDNDVTARRPERFRFRIRKRSPDEGDISLGTGETSDSGDQPGDKSTSGSGLWSFKSSEPVIQTKQTEKRSMNSNSLGSLLSALKAISSLAPDEGETSGDEIDASGSGLWLAPENEVDDDKLPKFFHDDRNFGSGENPEEALNMINEAAEKELSKKMEDSSSGEAQHETGRKLFKRDLKSDSLADDLMAAVENMKDNRHSDPEDDVILSSGSAMQESDDNITEKLEDETSGQPDEDQFTEKTEVKTQLVKASPETKFIRSLTDVILPDSFYRARRSSQENTFLRSDNNLGENDALDSDSLVARFYRDQNAHADAPDIMEPSVASLPSETEVAFSAGKQAKPEKREVYYKHSGDFSEPRVVYTREIRNGPDPIIERPAVYSRSEDESEMDSSFGGEGDDDDEATLMIHEREIREDGYVGCYEDKSRDRDLPTILSVPHLTPDSCRSACQGAGHAYAGVQYGYLCRCGDSYGKYTKVPDEECNALCSGDKAQRCGGFWRSAVFTTDGAMQPSKRGNFFHIDSVQPMTEDIFDIPRSEIPSGGDQSGEMSAITETATVSESAAPTHTDPEPKYAATVKESSGAYTQGIHRGTSLQESPVPSIPGVTVQESPLPSSPEEENALEDDTVAQTLSAKVSLAQASDDKTTHTNKETTNVHSQDSAFVNSPEPAQDLTSTPAISPNPPSQDSQRSDIEASTQQVTVLLDSPVLTTQEASTDIPSQHDQVPQGTHVSQLMYLHQQQDILSKPTPKTIVAVPPGKVEAGTVAYTGTIKLKQSWLDQFEDANSAESKILSGNIEQAFKRVFKNEPKFVNAEVVGFREGLVKHNPNTIRKVIAPFILTFKNGAKGIEEKLKGMVKNSERLDDMPVYKNSLQIAEYGHSPASEKAVTTNDTVMEKHESVKEKHESEDKKRSTVTVPNGDVDPFLKDIFNQISS